MIKGPPVPHAGRTSALDAKALKALIEAGKLSAGVDQTLLSARPGRVRFRVDVEPQSVPQFAVSRACLVGAPVRHHDGDFMIIGVNSFFHRTVLRTTPAYIEAPRSMQCRTKPVHAADLEGI